MTHYENVFQQATQNPSVSSKPSSKTRLFSLGEVLSPLAGAVLAFLGGAQTATVRVIVISIAIAIGALKMIIILIIIVLTKSKALVRPESYLQNPSSKT